MGEPTYSVESTLPAQVRSGFAAPLSCVMRPVRHVTYRRKRANLALECPPKTLSLQMKRRSGRVAGLGETLRKKEVVGKRVPFYSIGQNARENARERSF